MAHVRLAIEGLSIGDAFGEQFIHSLAWMGSPNARELPPPTWKYTDDTEMALAIAEVLGEYGHINQEPLAAAFARRHALDSHRGYGSNTHEVLRAIERGGTWRAAARGACGGRGSHGNGAAMRAAPVGAYFLGDGLETVATEAHRSAEVTHAHSDGIAGAIAVAVAAAWAAQPSGPACAKDRVPAEMFEAVLKHTPAGQTRSGIEQAAILPLDTWQFEAAMQLGNGEQVSAADTVPFCLWMVARHLGDYTEAMWNTVRVGGDIDTNCAIVGGILALAVSPEGIPRGWIDCREPLVWKSIRD
jgi:ADP-ribosylglycohydrolase